jgi:hypothetical protein
MRHSWLLLGTEGYGNPAIVHSYTRVKVEPVQIGSEIDAIV